MCAKHPDTSSSPCLDGQGCWTTGIQPRYRVATSSPPKNLFFERGKAVDRHIREDTSAEKCCLLTGSLQSKINCMLVAASCPEAGSFKVSYTRIAHPCREGGCWKEPSCTPSLAALQARAELAAEEALIQPWGSSAVASNNSLAGHG